MEHLYRKLKEYANTGYYPFHMPGHKRNTALIGSELPYELDITEIDGFDDLHHSEGILEGTAGVCGVRISCGGNALPCEREHSRAAECGYGKHKLGRLYFNGKKLS